MEILSDPASPEEEYIEPNTDETDVDTTMEEDTDSIDDGEHGQQDRIVTWARDFMDQEEASMETGDGDAVQENNTEEGKSINNVETDLAILVQEVTEACANLHTLTLRDVQLFLIRLNQLEMRSDGQDGEINQIMEETHGQLQFIVDMVTGDTLQYMTLGDGLAAQEEVNSSSDDVNDGEDDKEKEDESIAKENENK